MNSKSNNCIQNEHGACEGIVVEIINTSKITKICNCPCHNSMYNLIRNTLLAVNQRSNETFNIWSDY